MGRVQEKRAGNCRMYRVSRADWDQLYYPVFLVGSQEEISDTCYTEYRKEKKTFETVEILFRGI